MSDVYTETGKRVVFACAIDWPGWCRKGRGEDAALAELAAYAPRYAAVAELAGVPFDARDGAAGAFVVIERVPGTATTDFGALDVAPELDSELGQRWAAPPADGAGGRGLARVRANRGGGAGNAAQGPALFVGRRTAWHALDHAWEIADKLP